MQELLWCYNLLTVSTKQKLIHTSGKAFKRGF